MKLEGRGSGEACSPVSASAADGFIASDLTAKEITHVATAASAVPRAKASGATWSPMFYLTG